MRRRELLAAVVALFSGCSSFDGDDGSGSGVPAGSATTPSPRPAGTPSGTEPGNPLLRVGVHEEFDGSVVVTGSCITGELTVEAGDIGEVSRDDPDESCTYSVTVDGTEAISNGTVEAGERTTVIVTEDGTVENATGAT